MSNEARIAAAVASGYLLGRTKKMKLAITVGSLLAGQRIATSPRGLARQGQQIINNNPELSRLQDQLSGKLMEALRAAAVATVTSRLNSVSDSLRDRTDGLRGLAELEAPDLLDEDEPEEADEADEADEPEEADEVSQRRSASRSRRSPAKKASGKKTAAASAGRKTASRASTAKKTAKKAPATKKSTAKKTAAKKTTAKKTAAKKTTAKKAASGGSGAAKRTAAKKSSGSSRSRSNR
jgi:hypothetical protein